MVWGLRNVHTWCGFFLGFFWFFLLDYTWLHHWLKPLKGWNAGGPLLLVRLLRIIIILTCSDNLLPVKKKMLSSTISEQMNKTRQLQTHRFWNPPGMKPCWGRNKPMSQPACNVFVHARNKALRGRQFQSLTDRQSIQGCSNVKQTKNVYFTTYYSIQLILEDT